MRRAAAAGEGSEGALREASVTASVRAAGLDERPVGIARARVAREGPDIGDLGRMARVSLDHIAVLVARDVDLLGNEFDGHEGGAAVHLRLEDVHRLDPDERGLVGLPGVLARLDRAGKILEHPVVEERTQRLALAFREGGDDHLEGGLGTLDEVLRRKAGVGHRDLGQPRLERRARGRRRQLGRRAGVTLGVVGKRDDLVARTLRGLRMERIGALALLAGTPAEHAPQPQDQEGRDHGEEDDVDEMHVHCFQSAGMCWTGQNAWAK